MCRNFSLCIKMDDIDTPRYYAEQVINLSITICYHNVWDCSYQLFKLGLKVSLHICQEACVRAASSFRYDFHFFWERHSCSMSSHAHTTLLLKGVYSPERLGWRYSLRRFTFCLTPCCSMNANIAFFFSNISLHSSSNKLFRRPPTVFLAALMLLSDSQF